MKLCLRYRTHNLKLMYTKEKNNSGVILNFFILVLILIPVYLFAQTQRSNDSLKQKLSVSKNAKDSVAILCWLAWNSWNIDKQFSIESGFKALELSRRIQSNELIAEAYDAAALAYWLSENFDKAREYYKKETALGEKYQLMERIAWGNYNLADLSYNRGMFEDAKKYALKSKAAFKKLNNTSKFGEIDQILNKSYANTSPDIDSLNRSLSSIKSIDDSASIYNWFIWFNKTSDAETIFQCGKKVLELTERITNKEKLSESYDAIALTYLRMGDPGKAREYYNKALEVAINYNLSFRAAWEYYNLSDLSLREGKTEEAIELGFKSRKAFKENNRIENLLNRDYFLLEIYNYKNNSLIDSTIQDLKIAINKISDPDKLLNYYFNIIYLYDQQENKSKSISYAMKALEKAEEVNNRKAILAAYYQIGNYLRDYQKNYEVALLYYGKILEIYKQTDDKINIAGVLNDIGTVEKQLGEDSLALNYFNESLGIAEKINHRHSKANAYRNIAEIYYLRQDYKNALTYFLESYNTGCDKCPSITFHGVLIKIGNVYLNAKDYGNAQKYFNKGLHLADSAKANYEIAVSHLALADLYRALNNSNASTRHYHSALNYATEANSLFLQKEISAKLSSIYQEQKNFGKAFEYLKLSNNIADSLKKISDVENLARLETKFEFQNFRNQKEQELRESKIKSELEINKQSQLKDLFIAAFIFVTVLGIVIYTNYRRKQNHSKILEEKNKQLEEMSEKIHEADQKKISFFTNISHELRTPLTLILGPVEKLLKENPGNQSSSSLLNIVRRNTLQLYNLINQLLDIRKLDSGNVKLKVSEADIVGYVKGIYSTFIHLAEENNITYCFNTASDQITGLFDKDIVEKTLNNLLSNAFKYTPRHGEISLTISSLPGIEDEISQVKIVVRDNGKGIPADQVQYVFDRYYQVENTNTGFNTGTGIGLSYSKELIELHKGQINVESRINNGAVFTIILPIHKSFYSSDEISNGKFDVNETDNGKVRQRYLEQLVESEMESINDLTGFESVHELDVMLIIEDNTDLRTFIKSIFSNSYKIYEAQDGKIGYQMANEIIPDVIISDIMMPEMNGLELCDKLKSNIHTNHIPILILTAKTGEENEIAGLQTGADDYLTKPFNSEILEIRVKRLIDSREKLKEYFTREFLLNPKEVKLASPEDEFLKKAVKVVEENISNPNLNVELLMNELGVSRTQLFRKLKAITNYSASQFIRNIKLKRAAQLLQNKSYNITEVLYLSGFNSPSYFTACFKEMYGCLPKEYHSKTDNRSILTN